MKTNSKKLVAITALWLLGSAAAYAPPPGVALPPVVARAMNRLGIFDGDPVPQFTVGSPGSLKLMSIEFERLQGEYLVGNTEQGRLEARLPSQRVPVFSGEGERFGLAALEPAESLVVAYRGEPSTPTVSSIFRLGVSSAQPGSMPLSPIPIVHPESPFKVRPTKGWRGDAISGQDGVEFVLHPRSYQGALEPKLLVIDRAQEPAQRPQSSSTQLVLLGRHQVELSGEEVEELLALFLSGDEAILVSVYHSQARDRSLSVIGYSRAEEFAEYLPTFRSTVAQLLKP